MDCESPQSASLFAENGAEVHSVERLCTESGRLLNDF